MFKFLKRFSFLKKAKKEKDYGFLASVISVILGLMIGFILLFVLEILKESSNLATPFYAMGDFFVYPFSSISKLGKVLYQSTPIILTGLAVGFAFKAGLFNIGAAGQAAVGGFFALVATILWGLPWWMAIFIAIIAGGLWGYIPGLFKAQFNINEVITTIMLNWVSVNLLVLMFYNMPSIHTMLANKTDDLRFTNPSGLLPDLGMKEMFNSSYVSIGIFITIIVAVLVHVLLNKSIFGFEVKSCGFNKNASIYAGIKAKRTIIYTMMISGALAGLAGALYYLTGSVQYDKGQGLLGIGFDGIPVALLASSNPLGIIVSGLFIGYLKAGSDAFSGVYSPEVTEVTLSVIIYFSAFTLVIKQYINKLIKKRKINKIDIDKNEIVEDKNQEVSS